MNLLYLFFAHAHVPLTIASSYHLRLSALHQGARGLQFNKEIPSVYTGDSRILLLPSHFSYATQVLNIHLLHPLNTVMKTNVLSFSLIFSLLILVFVSLVCLFLVFFIALLVLFYSCVCVFVSFFMHRIWKWWCTAVLVSYPRGYTLFLSHCISSLLRPARLQLVTPIQFSIS